MVALYATLAPILAIAGGAAAKEAVREGTEWADISVSGADKDGLPRVLLMGDSIATATALADELTDAQAAHLPWEN